jgi:hypothetical protein
MIVKKNNAYRYKKTNSPSKKYIKLKQHHGKKTKRNVMVGGGLHKLFANEGNQEKFRYLTHQMVSFIVGSLFAIGLANTIAQIPGKINEFGIILDMMGVGDPTKAIIRIYEIIAIILSCMVNLTTDAGTQIIEAITYISIPIALRDTVATVSPLIMKELFKLLNLINDSKIYLFIASICSSRGVSGTIVSAAAKISNCSLIIKSAFEKIGEASKSAIKTSLDSIKSGASTISLGINYCTSPIRNRMISISDKTLHSAIDTTRDCKRNLDIPIDMLSGTISKLIINFFTSEPFEMSEDFASSLIKKLGNGLVTFLTHPRGDIPLDVFESDETEADLERAEESAKKRADEARAELIKELTDKFDKEFPRQTLKKSMSNPREKNRFNPLSGSKRRSSVGDRAINVGPLKPLPVVKEMEEGGSRKRRYKRNSQTKKRYRRKH